MIKIPASNSIPIAHHHAQNCFRNLIWHYQNSIENLIPSLYLIDLVANDELLIGSKSKTIRLARITWLLGHVSDLIV